MRRPSVVAMVAALLVPAAAGAIALASFDDRQDRTDQVRAAVVNLDEAVTITDPETGEEMPVLAGRLLAGELTAGDAALLGWELTDADAAASGLDDGTYEAAITIPENFSAAATSVSGDDPQQATIELEVAEAGSPVAAVVGEQVAAAAASAVGGQLTTQYLDQVLLGFGGVSTELGGAASGAQDLADGLGQLAEGAGASADGADGLALGAGDLASGIGELSSGASDLSDGAEQVSDGVAGLSTGLFRLEDGTASLPDDTRALADGAAQTSAGATQVSDGLTALQQQCAAVASPDALAVCAAVDQLAPGAQGVAAGAAGLATGTDRLADGAPQISSGISRSADGVQQLAPGARQLASGADQLADGVAATADGADELAAGASDLATGLDGLTTGATESQAGATQLAEGLGQGVGGVPSYTDDERAQLVRTVAQPVTTSSTGGLGSLAGSVVSGSVVPLVAVLVLWLGALATFLVRRALPTDAGRRAVSATRMALQTFGPAALVGFAQVLTLAAVVAAFGVDVASPVAAIAVGLLTALTFVALHQALIAVGGRFGQVLSLVLLVVQVASVGGLIPLATAPEAFQVLGGLLPLPLAVDVLTTLVQGGRASVATGIAGLVGWTVVSLAVTTWAARRRQQWSVASIREQVVGRTDIDTRLRTA